MTVMMRWYLVVLLVVLVIGATTRATTVAVLQGEEARKLGLGEVVSAELSKHGDVQLVEREKIKAVATEQALTAALGGVSERERLGSLVSADVLVLLHADAARVRAVVCDARLGVTLQDSSYATEKRSEELAGLLAEEVRATIKRFESGVKRVVAVTDFVCSDLTFGRSFLQSDYAELIRGELRKLPGVALVAVDEARAIGEERDIAGGQQRERLVPIFIEGEYRTSSPADEKPVVRLTLRARGAQQTLFEKTYESVQLEEAGKKLLEVYATSLAPLCGSAPGDATRADIDIEGQFKLLTQRANEFSELGEFRRSAALREAALLLNPDADAQRIQLVREYTRRNSRPVEESQWPKGAKAAPGDPFWMGICEQVVTDWKRSLQHCEYLVRNRRMCREEATDLAHNALHSITGIRPVGGGGPKMMAECEAIKKDFIREVFARIATLDPATREQRRRLTGALDVYHFLFDSALLRCEGNFYDREDLDLLAELLTQRLPTSMWPSYNLNFFFQHVAEGLTSKEKAYRFTEEEYLAFLEKLIASERGLVRVYGRFAKVCYRQRVKHEKSDALVEEAKGVLAAAQGLSFNKGEFDYYMGQLRDQVFWVSREAHPPVAEKEEAPAPQQPVAAARVKLERLEIALDSKLRTEKELKPGVRWRAPGGWGPVHRFRTMGEGLDVFWSHGVVLFMREPGKVIEVLADEKLSVNDVVSDGEFIWVAATYERGLYVLDRGGKVLAQIDQAHGGLPPTNPYGAPLLHPLGKGRVLATGSFGTEQRGWIALVEFDEKTGTSKVDVIHEGTKVWNHRATRNFENLDPAMCFVPEVVFEHVTPGPDSKRIVFIGRRYNPLLVDVEKRKVWVYPIKDWNKEAFPRLEGPAEAFASINGVLWVAGSMNDVRSYRWNETRGLFDEVRKAGNDWHSGGWDAGRLLQVDDWLYYVGNTWRRINLRTGAEQTLVEDPRALPGYGSGNPWMLGKSSHYGLVAFHYGELYRVTLLP